MSATQQDRERAKSPLTLACEILRDLKYHYGVSVSDDKHDRLLDRAAEQVIANYIATALASERERWQAWQKDNEAECSRLRAENARLRKVVECAARAWNKLAEMYASQDRERAEKGEVGSIHREIFESYIDDLTESAHVALAHPAPATEE